MKFWLLVPATLVLFSCANKPTPSVVYGTSPAVPAAYVNPVTYLKPTDRTPASAPQVYWETASRDFNVGPQGVRFNDNIELNQIQEWDEVQKYIGQCSEERPVRGNETVRVPYNCRSSGSAWEGPRDLAKKIKGIGDKSAEKLFAAGYLTRRPKTWSDFVQQLDQAQQNGVIQGSVLTATTITYMDENMMALGYDQQSCQYKNVSVPVWRDKWVNFPCEKESHTLMKQVINKVKRHVEITVENPMLQNFELDKIQFVTAGAQEVRVEGGPYTRYEMQKTDNGSDTFITLRGVARNHVDLPQDVITRAKLAPLGDKFQFSVSVDPKYIPQGQDANDQLVLAYTVNTCKIGWFGVCGALTSWTPAPTEYKVIQEGQVDIAIAIPKDSKGMVHYEIQRKNSRFYNDNFVHKIDTDSVKGQ